MFEINFGMVVVVGLLALLAAFSEALHTCVDALSVEITSWTLKRRGVADDEIRKIALAKVRRRRQNLVIQILKLLLDFIRLLKK